MNVLDKETPHSHALTHADRNPLLQVETLVSRSSNIDGFQRAVRLEQQTLCAAFAPAQNDVRDLLIALVADLYDILRSPIHPKTGYLSIAGALLKAMACDQKDVHLYGVLASPTAMKEVHTILNCATIFKRHGFRPKLHLILARWEYLCEIRQESPASRLHVFSQQVRDVGAAAQLAGFPSVIIPINVEVDAATGAPLSPFNVCSWWRRVQSTSTDPRGASPALVRDVEWSTGYYAGQRSLSRLGAPQALFDLALRRAIGAHISADHVAHSPLEGGIAAMVTLELHKRLLRCYDASLPILNLAAHTPVLGLADESVAYSAAQSMPRRYA